MEKSSPLEINEFALDKEWLGQPKLYLTYSQQLANAKLDMNEAKAELDVTYAELSKDIRDDPAKYGINKVTEPVVESTILLRKKYKAALAALNEAKHAVDLLTGMVEALDQRKRALENLVILQGRDYFASPKAPKGTEEEIQRIEKRSARKPLDE